MVEGRNMVAFRRTFFAEREPEHGDKHPEHGDKHPERRLTPRAADRAPRVQIGGQTRIEVGSVARLRNTHPRGG